MTSSTKRKLCLALLCCLATLELSAAPAAGARRRDYHYTRTRKHPNHLRISEDLKNRYVDEVKLESKINGTTFEYYRGSLAMSYDELVFETIDKMYRHRLSPFYIHHYDREHDKRRSGDPRRVSQEACARDLLYLVDKLPLKKSPLSAPLPELDDDDDNDHLTPELTAFFDSYARQEAGLLMGNTFWVGAYDQCVQRHIFELIDASAQSSPNKLSSQSSSSDQQQQQQQQQQQPKQQQQQFARDEHQQAVSFQGRYCVAALKAPSWSRLIEAKKAKARGYFKTERQLRNYNQLFRLQVGVCLPDSCDSTALERHRDELRLLVNSALADSRLAHYDLVDLFCLPDEASPLRQWSSSALYFWLFLALWLALVALATLADAFELFPPPVKTSDEPSAAGAKRRRSPRRSRLPQLVQCFSLRANYNKLMHVSGETKGKRAAAADDIDEKATQRRQEEVKEAASENDGQVEAASESGEEPATQQQQQHQPNLRFLNAFKVLIMFWIINGHIMLLMIQTAKNILNSDALLNELMHFLIGATFGVDLFFTMTGFLTSYLIFSGGHAHKMRPATWLYLSFHRYWRLAPMYLLSFWFSRSVMQSLGSGPLWDYGTTSITFRGLCNTESWWFPLTLTSNLHGLFEECMITSWYISCDMQFWLVSPIFIHLLARSPAQGWLAALLTIGASSKARYDAILTDKAARYDELVQPRADIFMRVSHDLPALYTHPQFRIAAYLVGLLAGHYVYLTTRATVEDCGSDGVSHAAAQSGGDESETQKQGGAQKLKKKSPAWRLRPVAGRTRAVLAHVGLFLFITMAFISYLLANFFPSSLLRSARTIAAIAYSVDHLAMSVGASLVIVCLCAGQWPRLERLLAHPNWSRLSKLNYALLLLQCEAIYYQIFRYEQVPLAGTRELINILFNLLVTLYPLAFLVTLAFEFPLANLEKLL